MEMDLGTRNIVINNVFFLKFRIFLLIGLILKFVEIIGMDLGHRYIVIFLYMK